MEELTKLIISDMKPALGVTEPGAIAFAVSKAKSLLDGEYLRVDVELNSGMYKNAFTCGIPNSPYFGNEYAAALGLIAGDCEKGLECLSGVKSEDNEKADEYVKSGKISIKMSDVSSRIYIKATVKSSKGKASVTIRDSHTNITEIKIDDHVVYNQPNEDEKKNFDSKNIHSYSLNDIYNYAINVPKEEITFIEKAYETNLALFYKALKSPKTKYARHLLNKNGGIVFSMDEQKTASLLCNAAIEARVLGIDSPAMSITGSGAHGIIATLPLYAVYYHRGLSKDTLYRATLISYLICMYIKEYSGKLSAFCGCGIAAGTGMACGLAFLKGGDQKVLEYVIANMASSITGMICDGGNHGCTMKGIVAVDAAFQSADFALNNICISNIHGINGKNAEDTMKYMGTIASPGMEGTEKTILEILKEKSSK